ncbi:MAG: hypothetical protein ACJ789_17275 [Thermomicrobiales bacterium]
MTLRFLPEFDSCTVFLGQRSTRDPERTNFSPNTFPVSRYLFEWGERKGIDVLCQSILAIGRDRHPDAFERYDVNKLVVFVKQGGVPVEIASHTSVVSCHRDWFFGWLCAGEVRQ